MLEKCHHITLTDSFAIVQKNQFLVPGSELRTRDEWNRQTL